MKQIYLFLLLLLATHTQAQPDKIWATYFGAEFPDACGVSDIAYDTSGYLYIAGFSYNTAINLATPGSFQPNFPGTISSGFLAKFDTFGNRIWSTYIGNDLSVYEPHIALDPGGNIYVTGSAMGSQNLLGTPGAFRPELPPTAATVGVGYLLKFSPQGSRLWGTYLENQSVSSRFFPLDIASGSDGTVLICGRATSDGEAFSPGTYKPISGNNGYNGFLLKFSAAGNRIWGSYYGNGSEELTHLAVDAAGAIYAGGTTNSDTAIATSGTAFINHTGGQVFENFVVKFTAAGQRIWGSYTNGMRGIGDLVLNGSDGFYLSGLARDTGIGTPGTYQPEFIGNSLDLCLSRWDANGQKIWGTYYGGSEQELLGGIFHIPFLALGGHFQRNNLSLDPEGNILMAGATKSPDQIKVGCTYSDWNSAGRGCIAKFYPDGKIMWGSYYDIPVKSVVCGRGTSFYLLTTTSENGLATPGVFQTTKTPNHYAGFISKMEGDYQCPKLSPGISADGNRLYLQSSFSTYQWFFNDEALNNAQAPDLLASDTGWYYVELTDSCNCKYISDPLYYPPVDSGINVRSLENGELASLKVFPNPFNKHISVKTLAIGDATLTLFDIAGRTILTRNLSHAKSINGTRETELNTTDLQPGMYFLHYTRGGRYSSVVKLLKLPPNTVE